MANVAMRYFSLLSVKYYRQVFNHLAARSVFYFLPIEWIKCQAMLQSRWIRFEWHSLTFVKHQMHNAVDLNKVSYLRGRYEIA